MHKFLIFQAVGLRAAPWLQASRVVASPTELEASSFSQSQLGEDDSATSFIQTRVAARAIHTQTPANYRSSFVSVNGLLCVEGPGRIAEGALALKKAGVMGELYNAVIAHPNVSCAERGFHTSVGEDSCYPGAQRFSRGGEDFQHAEDTAMSFYAQNWNLTTVQVALMASCTCHPDSLAMASRPASCSSIGLEGSWMHHDPFRNEDQLMCDGGPFQHATYVLAILKSTAQLAMHRFDQIAPVSCASLGFSQSSPIDHCFPRLHMNWQNPDSSADAGMARSVEVESSLFPAENATGSRLDDFGGLYGIDMSIINKDPGCHCLSSSEVGQSINGACDPPELHTSPIREWYDGQDFGA